MYTHTHAHAHTCTHTRTHTRVLIQVYQGTAYYRVLCAKLSVLKDTAFGTAAGQHLLRFITSTVYSVCSRNIMDIITYEHVLKVVVIIMGLI